MLLASFFYKNNGNDDGSFQRIIVSSRLRIFLFPYKEYPQWASRGTRSPWEAPIHSHIPGPLPSPVTQRKSLSDTPCETVHIPSPISFHFTLFKSASAYVNRAPPPGPHHKTNYTTFRPSVRMCMCVCKMGDAKQQRFADSRLCDVQSFYSLSSSVHLSLRQCQSSYSQPASQSVRVHSHW